MDAIIAGNIVLSYDVEKTLKDYFAKIHFHLDERIIFEANVEKVELVICNSFFVNNDISKYTNLKYIIVLSQGKDRIPMQFCRSNNIKVFFATGLYSNPISEFVVMRILEIYKNSYSLFQNQMSKLWIKNRQVYELNGKKVLIYGVGNIGTKIADKLKPFYCRIYGIDLEKTSESGFEKIYAPNYFEELVKLTDILIITVPLNKYTRNLIDKRILDLMKNESVIINVSRGEIIDEDALVSSLKKCKFLGVALDVFRNEPLENSELWDFQRVLISPHISYASELNKSRLNVYIENTIKLVLDGKG